MRCLFLQKCCIKDVQLLVAKFPSGLGGLLAGQMLY